MIAGRHTSILIRQQEYRVVGQLYAIQEEVTYNTPTELQAVLAVFQDVFAELKGLLPERVPDHDSS